MFKVTNEDIENLVDKEYENATQYGNTYNSDHEFYAVLKEEIEEVYKAINSAHIHFEIMWKQIKDDIEFKTDHIEKELKETIKESLQCLAVIKKYKN